MGSQCTVSYRSQQALALLLVTLYLSTPQPLVGQQGEGGELGATQIQKPAPQQRSLEGGGEGPSVFTVVGKITPGGELTTQDTRVLLTLSGGEQITEFVRLDGSFTLRNVPVGVHVLEVFHLGFLFPQIR